MTEDDLYDALRKWNFDEAYEILKYINTIPHLSNNQVEIWVFEETGWHIQELKKEKLIRDDR